MRATQGFALTELIIIIAIIGILATLAVPAYKDYTVRSKVTETLVFSSILKQTISENYFSRGCYLNGRLDCQGISNISFNSNNISSIYCDNTDNSIQIQTTEEAGDVAIVLLPSSSQKKLFSHVVRLRLVNSNIYHMNVAIYNKLAFITDLK